MFKKLLSLVFAILIASSMAKAEIGLLVLDRSSGELIESEDPAVVDKIEVLFSAQALSFNPNGGEAEAVDANFDWDFNNDGITDASGAEVNNQFDFESAFEEFSFGYPVKLTATDNNDQSQVTKNILFKPSKSAAPVLTLDPVFSELRENVSDLKFKLRYFTRLNEDSSNDIKVRLLTRVEPEYKRFVSIKGKVKSQRPTATTQTVIIDKNKIRAEFPDLDRIEIPIHNIDTLSGFTARQLISVDLQNVSSFVVDENIVAVAEGTFDAELPGLVAPAFETRMRTFVMPAKVDGTFPLPLTKFQDPNGIVRFPDAVSFELDANNAALKKLPSVIVTKDDIGNGQLGTAICSTQVFKKVDGPTTCRLPVNMTPNMMLRVFNGKNASQARIHVNALFL